VVADAIETSRATAVDLRALREVIRSAVEEGVSADVAAQRIEQQTPMFGAVGRWLNANQGLFAVLALVVALLGPSQPNEQQPVPPPSATAPVAPSDRAELARRAEEQLREQEQREQEQRDDDAQQTGEPAPAEPDQSPDGGGCGSTVR
jgi:hypothetical protein